MVLLAFFDGLAVLKEVEADTGSATVGGTDDAAVEALEPEGLGLGFDLAGGSEGGSGNFPSTGKAAT